MEDSEYGGVRIEMKAAFGKTVIPIHLDISTGDAIMVTTSSELCERALNAK